MKQFKIILFVTAIALANNCLAQVQIGDLYYYLSGTSASVAFKGYGFYDKDAYTIPSTINYNGLDYLSFNFICTIILSAHSLPQHSWDARVSSR